PYFVATDFAENHAVGVHALAHADQVPRRHRADALNVGLAGLQRFAVRMELREPIEPELELGLDCDDALLSWDLRSQRTEHGRLSRSGGSGDHEAEPRPNGRGEKGLQ